MFLRMGRRSDMSVAALIPNLLTTLALSCGLASIHFSAKASVLWAALTAQHVAEEAARAQVLPFWERALAAILFSAIFDALDGRAARLLRVTSGFGAVLDSLSDFVSFGVAPALILHQWTLGDAINNHPRQFPGVLGLFAVTTFALCSGLRLARFTAAANAPAAPERGKSAKPASSAFFVGMPTPAAAGAVLIPAMLDASPTFNLPLPDWLVVVYTLGLGFLMISRIPMFSLKKIRLGPAAVAPILVLVGFGVAGMITDPWLTLSIIAGAYVLSLPFAVVMKYRQRAGEPEVERARLAG
jgi:CDP-diacylglycerol---serine O-phosphatidyltransferase